MDEITKFIDSQEVKNLNEMSNKIIEYAQTINKKYNYNDDAIFKSLMLNLAAKFIIGSFGDKNNQADFSSDELFDVLAFIGHVIIENSEPYKV